MSDWYDNFLGSIGIDPSTTEDFSESPSAEALWEAIQGANLGAAGWGTIANAIPGLSKLFGNAATGSPNYGALAAVLGGLYGANQSSSPTVINPGYQGGIPEYTATRSMVTAPPAGRRPGSGGINYGGDVVYTKTGKKLGEGMAKGGLAADGFVIPADVVSHFGNGSSEAGLKLLAQKLNAQPIKGEGDGMSDSIPTTIDGTQPARVANDEAFVPPQVVKEIGGGDTERGAKKLYAMMDRIRKARTGTTEQGKQINPEKFMPGGKVQRYADGGTTGVTSESLATWAGPYVADMLGKGKALSEMPYQAYTGPLTAGPSGLQTQAFGAAQQYQAPTGIGQAAQTAGDIASKAQGLSYTPVGGLFGTAEAQQYMNPYLQASLDPQLREMRRQADISRQADAARTAQAGAFGGGRQAIMESEARRNLLGQQSNLLSQGYATAYDKAAAQFNADQTRKIQEAQFGAGLGLQGLQTGLQAAESQGRLGATEGQAELNRIKSLADLGAVQRGIEAEGIAADKAQFEEARLNPYKMLQFQQSLLQGLPLAAQTVVQPGQSNLQQFSGGFTTVAKLMQALGLLPKETTPAK